MSESENKAERDPNGFLNCQKLCISTSQQCSRRYLTVVGFENHVKVEHSDLNRKQTEEQQDANCVPSYLAHAKIQPKFQKDQESFLKSNILLIALQDNLKSHQLKECNTLAGEKEIALTIKFIESLLLTNAKNARSHLEEKPHFKST